MHQTASLHYYIAESLLEGTVGGKHFCFFAASGSGRGRKPEYFKAELQSISDHSILDYRRGKNESRGVRGGPIPPGGYTIMAPVDSYINSEGHSMGRAAKLNPDPKTAARLGQRSGFLIHGRGKLGSDGCIVPLRPQDLQALMNALGTAKGGVLQVSLYRNAVNETAQSFA